jgi:outer membrane biosynthesis protein TonB
MVIDNKQIATKMKFEIDILESAPEYINYKKFNEEYQKGKKIEELLLTKISRYNQAIKQLQLEETYNQQQDAEEPEEEQEDPEEYDTPQPKPQPKQELRQNKPVNKVQPKQQVKNMEEQFSADASEMGLNDDIPGLPEDIE